MRRIFAVVLLGGMFAGLAVGQEARQTGTNPGQVLPGPYSALVVSNPDAPKPPDGVVSEDRANLGDLARVGKFHDFVTYYGLDPTVAVFTRQLPQGPDSPLGKLLHTLDQAVAKNRNARLHAFVVFLTLKGPFLDDPNQPVQIQQVRDVGEHLKLTATPLALDLADSEQSKSYDIPADATTVVVVYVNHKIEARHVFTADKPLNDAAIQTILGDANKLIGKGK